MANDYSGKIIGIVIALLLAGILLPIGLDSILAYNGTSETINLLVTTVVPVMAVIGIVMMFLIRKK
jgi:uncharacterized membrane protein YraQ (UPF0718 family)